MTKGLFIWLLILAAIAVAATYVSSSENIKLKLLTEVLRQPLDQVVADYAGRSCDQFSDVEIKQGYFWALITGYCRPQAQEFANRHDFLCAVGLNCTCPNGRDDQAGCASPSGLKWPTCLDFNDKNIPYCNQTALATEPKLGDVAADWQCFTPGSTININDRDYHITDKGQVITGRRFDLWFDKCADAMQAIGIYKVRIP